VRYPQTAQIPALVMNNPDIINDQVNEFDVFMGEMGDEYE